MYIKRLKRVLALGMGIGLLLSPGFAQGVAECTESAQVVNNIMIFLSRAWAGFAIIAGKLMTNDFVVGGVFGLDAYIFKIHTIMRNFANFALGFFLLYVILKNFFSSEDGLSAIGKKIGGLLLAGILIQASWFIVLAVVDISTVLTSSIGSLPSIFISQDDEFADQSRAAYAYLQQGKDFVYDLNADADEAKFLIIENDSAPVDEAAMNDFFLPSNKTLSGPLIYIGTSILGVLRQAPGSGTINSCESMFLDVFMDLGVIVLYSLALLILTIINVMRLGLIWMLLALAPIFFLMWGLQWGGAIQESSLLPKDFTFKAFIQLIFVPVKVVLVLSMLLIFLTSVRSILKTGTASSLDEFGVECSISDGVEVCKFANTTLSTQGDVFGEEGGLTDNLSHIIVVLFTIFGMWLLIKLTLTQGSGFSFIDNITKGWFKKIEELLASSPIIPVPGGGTLSSQGLQRLGREGKAKTLQGVFGTDKPVYNIADIDRPGRDGFDGWMADKLGGGRVGMTQAEENELELLSRKESPTDFSTYARQLAKSAAPLSKGFTLNDPVWSDYLYKWAQNHPRNKGVEGVDLSSKEKALESIFNNPIYLQEFLQALEAEGLEPERGGGSPTNYAQFKTRRYIQRT